MAKKLPLPHRNDLPEMVLLHREHPSDPMVILQVPNESRTDSETYVIDMDESADRTWLEDLPNQRELRDKLMVAQHIVFSTKTGYVQEVEDLDMPSPVSIMLAGARKKAVTAIPAHERMSVRRRNRSLPGTSLLRRLLGGSRAS